MNKSLSDIYSSFSLSEGNEQIATEFSYFSLAQILSHVKPNEIVELGGGLGTLTQLALEVSSGTLVTFEDNPYCLGRLAKLETKYRPRLEVRSDYHSAHSIIPKAKFVICDVNQNIFDLSQVRFSSTETWVFIEGHQLQQRSKLMRAALLSSKVFDYVDLRPSKDSKGCALLRLHSGSQPLMAFSNFLSKGLLISTTAYLLKLANRSSPMITRLGLAGIGKQLASFLGFRKWY